MVQHMDHTSLIPSIFLNACVSIVLALIKRLSHLRHQYDYIMTDGHRRLPVQMIIIKTGLMFACVSIVLGFSVVIVTFYRSENAAIVYVFSASMICIIAASMLLIVEQLLADETDPTVIESLQQAATPV